LSTNPFRSPTSNSRYTKSLFYEESYGAVENCIYTLKDEDHKGYKSLYKLYMEMEDPTEYDFANRYLDSYEHWEILCSLSWFAPYAERWRKELDLKLRARALANVKEIAADQANKACFSANRFLLEGGWRPKEAGGKVGRPSKESIKAAAEELFSENKQAMIDLERITTRAN